MRIKARLNIYKKLLHLYSTKDKSILTPANHLDGGIKFFAGFCGVIMENYRIEIEELPELCKFKPKRGWNLHNGFWYRPDNINTRVKILKATIFITKQSMEDK